MLFVNFSWNAILKRFYCTRRRFFPTFFFVVGVALQRKRWQPGSQAAARAAPAEAGVIATATRLLVPTRPGTLLRTKHIKISYYNTWYTIYVRTIPFRRYLVFVRLGLWHLLLGTPDGGVAKTPVSAATSDRSTTSPLGLWVVLSSLLLYCLHARMKLWVDRSVVYFLHGVLWVSLVCRFFLCVIPVALCMVCVHGNCG